MRMQQCNHVQNNNVGKKAPRAKLLAVCQSGEPVHGGKRHCRKSIPTAWCPPPAIDPAVESLLPRNRLNATTAEVWI